MPRKLTGKPNGRPRSPSRLPDGRPRLTTKQIQAVVEEAKRTPFNETPPNLNRAIRNIVIAKIVGISKSILYRWQKLASYQEALDAEITRSWSEASTKLGMSRYEALARDQDARVRAQAEFMRRQTSWLVRQKDGSQRVRITNFDPERWTYPKLY
jgi:hypothetical protein